MIKDIYLMIDIKIVFDEDFGNESETNPDSGKANYK